MNYQNITYIIDRITFCLIVFFTGIVVLPATGAVGAALMVGGIICPIGALIKLIAALPGYDIPISLFEIGSYHIPVAAAFIPAVVCGMVLIAIGRFFLELTGRYIRWIVSVRKRMLEAQDM
ncbi:MAG: hypothetical protein ACI32N_04210 [Bulleidia sp.]